MFHCDHASKGKATLLSTLELALCPAPPWPCLPGCLKGISNSICLQFHCPSSFQPGKPAPPRLSISEIAIIIHPIVLTKKPRIRHSCSHSSPLDINAIKLNIVPIHLLYSHTTLLPWSPTPSLEASVTRCLTSHPCPSSPQQSDLESSIND